MDNKALAILKTSLDNLTAVMMDIREELKYRNKLETDLREYHEDYKYDSFRYDEEE